MPLGLFLILLKYAILVALMAFVALVLREMILSLAVVETTPGQERAEADRDKPISQTPSVPEAEPAAQARPRGRAATPQPSRRPQGPTGQDTAAAPGDRRPDSAGPVAARARSQAVLPEQSRPHPPGPAPPQGPADSGKIVEAEAPSRQPASGSASRRAEQERLVRGRARLHRWAEEREEGEDPEIEASAQQSGASEKALGTAQAVLEVSGPGVTGLAVGHAFLVGQGVHIGRASSNDVVLPDSHVSRQHAYLGRRGDHWVLVDKGSVNGTAVNGRRVTGPVMVHDGDVLALGSVKLVFRCPGGSKGD